MIRFNTLFLIALTLTTLFAYIVEPNIAMAIVTASLSALILIINFLLVLFTPATKHFTKRLETLEQEQARLKTAINLKNWEQ